MSVITFVNGLEKKTGKTMSLVAIATNTAINYNYKTLIISTTNREDKIKSCFFEDGKPKKGLGVFTDNRVTIESETGIEGIAKLVRSNRLTPELIMSHAKAVFKDRLEVILGPEKNGNSVERINQEYVEIIRVANEYYDNIFVDLDNNLDEETTRKIIDMSDLVVISTNQNYSSLKKLKEYKKNSELFKLAKTLILVGRYDKHSKYNSKNISRFLGEKNQVLTMPYNTLYFEAAEEAGVPDLIMNLNKLSDPEDRNTIFIEEIKRASDKIIYILKEQQMLK